MPSKEGQYSAVLTGICYKTMLISFGTHDTRKEGQQRASKRARAFHGIPPNFRPGISIAARATVRGGGANALKREGISFFPKRFVQVHGFHLAVSLLLFAVHACFRSGNFYQGDHAAAGIDI